MYRPPLNKILCLDGGHFSEMEFPEEHYSSGVTHSSNVIALIDIGSSGSNSGSCYKDELEHSLPSCHKGELDNSLGSFPSEVVSHFGAYI